MLYAIETRELTKRFGKQTAVDNVTLQIRQGEIYGLIGKNGAGKTTLMKLILGLSVPNSGEIRLFDGMETTEALGKTGALVEIPALYPDCTAYENMVRFGLLSGATEENINDLLSFVGLANTGKKKVGKFSLGMKQRLGIAVALLGFPELLILDEPVNGLDPTGIKEIRDVILDLNRRGITFLISSHLLDELGKIATCYGIMSKGKLVEEITAKELEQLCRSSLEVVTDNGPAALEALRSWRPELEMELAGNTVRITTEISDPSDVNLILGGAGIRVYEMKPVGMNPEDYFIERMG